MNPETAIAVMLTSFGNATLIGYSPPLPPEDYEQQDFRFIFSGADEIRGINE
jgi:hypothetical protein